ncbi:ATP-binding cassette subfamily B protein [Streptacidiphilus sp. MAP12-16]|uniref:ABC transporter ATP-binding protein n=1 Tax=Streptacidiphilus sp. MAP12-16 TaxID=3156300 RepID=UPI00351958D4
MHDTLMIKLGDLANSARRHRRISPVEAFKRLWPLARRHRLLMLVSALGLVVSAACDTAAIQVFEYLTDHVLTTGRIGAFWIPAGIWLAVAVLGASATFVGSYTASWVGEHCLLEFRDRVFRHVQRLPPDFFDNRQTGDLVARLTSDIDAMEPLMASTPVTLVNTAVSMVFFAGAALWVRWDLALMTFAAAPLFWFAARVFSSRIRGVTRDERDANGALTTALEENLANMTLVQAYNREETEREKVHREGLAWLRNAVAAYRLSYAYGPLAEVIETVCVLAVVGAGAWEISAGRLTLGGLLAFAAYIGYLFPHIQSLGSIAIGLSSSTAAAERVFEVLAVQPSVQDAPGIRPSRPGPGARGVISFEQVAFTYPGSQRRILEDLSCTAWPGQLVLLDGPSGAGKSTLAKLLLRLYDPAEGRITLDGVDLRDLTLRELRDQVTLVPQETMVFHGTIRENIAYGRPGATGADVRQAAVDADLDGFVSDFPDGYDTVIGQNGRLLSGGQRQRLAIARAIIRDTPVLILDEPTTGLDDESAARVMAPLRRLMGSRTTFLITHDQALATQADVVLPVTPGAGPHPRIPAAGPSRARAAVDYVPDSYWR